MTLHRRRHPLPAQPPPAQPPPPNEPSSPADLPKPKPFITPVSSTLRITLLPFLLAYTTILSLLIVSPQAQRNLTYLNHLSLNPIFPPGNPSRYRLHGRFIQIGHLHGWHIPPPRPLTTNFTRALLAPRQTVIIYHHGNAGTRAWPRRVDAVKILSTFLHAHVVTFDYSGFGDTPGRPTEQQIYDDAKAVYKWVKSHTNDADIWIYGQSLGTFPSVELATQLCDDPKPRGVILEAPPTSLIDAAMTHPASRPFRIFPRMKHIFRAVLHEKLDSLEKIGKVCMPLLIMHGDSDYMIPIEQGEMLYHSARMAGVDVRFVKIGGYGHKNVNAAPQYPGVVLSFLDQYARFKTPVRDFGDA